MKNFDSCKKTNPNQFVVPWVPNYSSFGPAFFCPAFFISYLSIHTKAPEFIDQIDKDNFIAKKQKQFP